nr:hypothetical protein [Tanacetum cinerariifolium]
MIQRMVTESLEYAILAKESSQPQSSYEAAASLTKFELKKILIDKIDKSESYLAASKHRECYEGLIKSYKLDNTCNAPLRKEDKDGKTPQQGPTQSWLMTLASSADKPSKTFNELMSTHIDFSAYIMKDLKISNLTHETLLGLAFKLLKGISSNYVELEYDFKECYKALSEKLYWDNPEGGDYPFDLTKPLPLVMNGNRQMVPVDYFFNKDLKYLQGEILTMAYTTSLTKTKAAQYDLPNIKDMVPNIWSPVKVVYDKYALWGISHWRDQCKSFYGYARGLESTHDVYSTKRNLAVTRVEVMRKHGFENVFRSIVIHKQVEDLQLEVKSYQKKITVTKPETTRPCIRKKDPYTSYQDPQGFIYIEPLGRNRLMRSDELYKFSDATLTRLQTWLEDITKNIHMDYLPKKR